MAYYKKYTFFAVFFLLFSISSQTFAYSPPPRYTQKPQIKSTDDPNLTARVKEVQAGILQNFLDACSMHDYTQALTCFSTTPTLRFEQNIVKDMPIILEPVNMGGKYMKNLVNYIGDKPVRSPLTTQNWFGDKKDNIIQITFQIGVPQYQHQETMVVDANNKIIKLGTGATAF